MLSDEELAAIKALDLSPEIEEAIIVSEQKHRELLYATKRSLNTGLPAPRVTNALARENQIKKDRETISGARRRPAKDTDLIPWNVQFGE